MPRIRRSSHRRHLKKNKKLVILGGSGAAEHAISTYGGIGEQHAVAGGNVIAMSAGTGIVNGSNPNIVPATIKGGGDSDSYDGGVVTEESGGALPNLAVPAVLLVANQMMTKRRRGSRKNKRRSHRRRR